VEYRLNKIDTDLRQKINDAAKSGKVHGAKNITVDKDKNKKNNEQKGNNSGSYKKLNKLIVDASKVENIQVDAFKESSQTKDKTKGNYLDIKK
jgi:hypothetical protein